MFVPGVEELSSVPATNEKRSFPSYAGQMKPDQPSKVYRNTSLYAALEAALNQVGSRKYGSKYEVTLSALRRNEIEEAFDSAMQQAHHSQKSANSSVTITCDDDPEDTMRGFPLYRCEKDSTWTMVVKNARIAISFDSIQERTSNVVKHAVKVDYLKVNITDGRT
eukprot:TRINITY_DN18112_c0_g1_i1.p1 TRINITY_DN18112_c0_g1~~TRINITY_DN18112_c0_g1_i1.p1  ORF type:complete len:165 (+),score=29.18 TRINITY_DN18112_c0_g1_i1:46-540(+)